MAIASQVEGRKDEDAAARTVDVLVVGGGYSGLWGAVNAVDVARECKRSLRVALISRYDFLTHRPRLYEKDPETLRVPLRPLLDPLGIELVHGEATGIDTDGHRVTVQTAEGEVELGYQRLVLATGSELRRLPIPGVDEHGLNVDCFEGAVAFDRHLKEIVAQPELEGSNTFVVVGAGMTGIELSTELRDRIAQHADEETAEAARIVLVEQAPAVAPTFGDSPRPVIEEALDLARVETRVGVGLTKVGADRATLSDGEEIVTRTTVITVGMRASALTEQIAAERDEMGRLHVDEELRVKGVEDVFASGDVAYAYVDEGHVAMMACQNSRTMGKYVGRNVAADLLEVPYTPYRQADYTTCLDLGRFGAVYTEGFDRELRYAGETAKERKRMINTEMIYPPAPGSDEEILAGMRIDARGR